MIRAALVLLLVCATVHADTLIELPKTKARLELPDKWQPLAAPSLVAAYAHPAGSLLVIARNDAPNSDAWSDDKAKNQAYADAIERGLKSATPGYKRVARKLGRANDVPALDIEATREGGATLIVRALLFKTYSLTLTIEVPKKGDIAVARAIAAKFTPPKEPVTP